MVKCVIILHHKRKVSNLIQQFPTSRCFWSFHKNMFLQLVVFSFLDLTFFNIIFKACVRYFLSIFYFFTKWKPKLWKTFFVSSKKLFPFSRYSHFCIFPLLFHTFQTQKDKWNWSNLWCHELACINLQM